MTEVEEFINRRFKDTNANWLNGNCYWFAYILVSRFDYLKIYYDGILGHFYASDGEHYYDWNGLVIPEYPPQFLGDIHREDSLWYDRIIEDCVM